MVTDTGPPSGAAELLQQAHQSLTARGIPGGEMGSDWHLHTQKNGTPELRLVKSLPNEHNRREDQLGVLRIVYEARREATAELFQEGLTVWCHRFYKDDIGSPYRGISVRVGFAPSLGIGVVSLFPRIEAAASLVLMWDSWEFDEVQPLPDL